MASTLAATHSGGARPRVAIVLPTYFARDLDFSGGGDRYAYRVAEALRPHCDVVFVTFGPAESRRTIDGLCHVVVRANGRDPENPTPTLGFFLRERFDVIHVYQLRAMATSLLALVCRLKRTPLVVTDVGGGGRSLMFRLQLYRQINRFICISDFSRSILPSAVRSRAEVVKGGIDLARFKYDARPRMRRVLQVGRIMPHKGFNYLIDAAGTDIPVVIAGRVKDQDYYQYLRRLAEGKQVEFLIDPPDEVVDDLYRTSAVTVAASVYTDVWGGRWPTSELLGLTLLESMAVGTPVVCTRVGGMPEYVEDGAVGFIVPPNDPAAIRARVVEILSDADRAREMGERGRKHVTQFDWSAVGAAIAEEYLPLVARDRAPT